MTKPLASELDSDITATLERLTERERLADAMVRATADTRWMSELDLYLAGAELRVFDQAYPEVQQLGTNRQSAALAG